MPAGHLNKIASLSYIMGPTSMNSTICVFCFFVCLCVCMCVCIDKLDEINQRISGMIASFLEVFVLHAKIMNSNLRCAPVFVHYFSM